MTYEVFISYSFDDKKAADAVCHSLEQQQVRCWIAPRDILPGSEWGASIIDAIDTVRVMVLVFSESSNRSPQVRREIERAVNKGVVLLPFRIEDVFPCKTLEYFLGTQHWLDAFQKPLAPHIDVLTRTVKAILANHDPDAPMWAVSAFDESPADAVTAPVSPSAATTQQAEQAFPAALLTALEHQLARHIGPLAKVLVSRAAQHASSHDELVGLLAIEIDNAADKAAFMRSASSVPA